MMETTMSPVAGVVINVPVVIPAIAVSVCPTPVVVSNTGMKALAAVAAALATGVPSPIVQTGFLTPSGNMALARLPLRLTVDGLTCRNRQGHGFFLSREKQRVF
jgi:hypothetical protein